MSSNYQPNPALTNYTQPKYFKPIVLHQIHSNHTACPELMNFHRRRIGEMLFRNSLLWQPYPVNVSAMKQRSNHPNSSSNQPPTSHPTPTPNNSSSHHNSSETLHINQGHPNQANPMMMTTQAKSPPKKRRGNLPKHVTAILKSWLLEHVKHPYPTEEEKVKLACETGLTLNQISNWFINARRRILQPVIDSCNSQNGLRTPHPDNMTLSKFKHQLCERITSLKSSNLLMNST